MCGALRDSGRVPGRSERRERGRVRGRHRGDYVYDNGQTDEGRALAWYGEG
jgi:hypothetical protein